MNETRDLIIGIDLRNDSSQLCYYDRNADEPRSLPVKVGSSQYEVPTCLCRRVEQKDYCIGIEAEYFAREKGGFLIEDLCGISQSRNTVQVAGEEKQPWEILAYFLEGMLKLTGVAEVNRNIRCLTVAMESLDDIQVENLQKAGKLLEIPENSFIIMDHEESFYYYIMGQKAETWNRSVGWYNFDNNHVTFRKMVMSSGAKPVMVKLEDPIETDLNDTDDEQRDADFYTFAKNTLGNELYSSIQIDGKGFEQDCKTSLLPEAQGILWKQSFCKRCLCGWCRAFSHAQTERLPLSGKCTGHKECRNGYAYYGCTGVLSVDRSRKKLV